MTPKMGAKKSSVSNYNKPT
jgi:hypothetical protein